MSVAATVLANVLNLLKKLPSRSALKRPLVRFLLRGVGAATARDLLDDPKYGYDTLYKYLSVPKDSSILLMHEKTGVKRPRTECQEERAHEWIRNECGTTLSGRKLNVKRTALSRTGLWNHYRTLPLGELGFDKFMEICHAERVHFHVGPCDAMSCVNCRYYESKLEELDSLDTREAEKERCQILAIQADHIACLTKQHEAYREHLERAYADHEFGVISIDFSTLDQSDRGHISDLCVTIAGRAEDGGGLSRMYVDYLGLQTSGRRRDVVLWVILTLQREGFLTRKQYVLWSDAGTSDFHSAPAMYAFGLAAKVMRMRERPIFFESFNFFGARHGWNDCDRHFGAISHVVTHWFATVAVQDHSTFLDIPTLMELMERRMTNTHVFDCRKVEFVGVVCASVPTFTTNYCFETQLEPPSGNTDVTVLAKSFSNSLGGTLTNLPGYAIKPDVAKSIAGEKVSERVQKKANKKRKTLEPAKKGRKIKPAAKNKSNKSKK
jgi:hypothetical protein